MRKLSREEKLKEILNASLILFHSKGFSNVVMNDIAKECGMARSTLYDYFPSKYDILLKLIGDLTRTNRQTVPIGETIFEKIVFLATDLFTKFQENRLILKIHLQENSNFTKVTIQQFAELTKQWTLQMTALFKEAMKNGEIEPDLEVDDIVFTYQALINEKKAEILLADKTIVPEEVARKLMTILWYGIKKKEPEK
jgi:AcrR family transcriptional regulator